MKILQFFKNNIFGILSSCILGMIVSFFTKWNVFLMLGIFIILYFVGVIIVIKIRKILKTVKYKDYNVAPDKNEANKIIRNVKNDYLLELEDNGK